jgi:hypothetical protein
MILMSHHSISGRQHHLRRHRVWNPAYLWGAIAAISLISCASPTASHKSLSLPDRGANLKAIELDEARLVMGQTVYVPIYSHIYYYNSQDHVMNLSATLSIRNTDLRHAIILTAVRYYDTNGQLVRQEIETPVELPPLASTDFFVAVDDVSGGAGANYIVEWAAENRVYEPVIEAVMISTTSSQGISFISPGKVIQQFVINRDINGDTNGDINRETNSSSNRSENSSAKRSVSPGTNR